MRTLHVGLEPASPLRLVGATLTASACGWMLVEHVSRFPLALLCASACLGVLAGTLRRGTSWVRVIGPVVLAGGAVALGGRFVEEGLTPLAWPLFALALTAGVAGPLDRRLPWLLGALAFGALLPLVRFILRFEGSSLAAALVAGALVAGGAWLAVSIRVETPPPELPDEGPYRGTWRSRKLN